MRFSQPAVRNELAAPQGAVNHMGVSQAAREHMERSGFGPRLVNYLAARTNEGNTYFRPEYASHAPRILFAQEDAYTPGAYSTLAQYLGEDGARSFDIAASTAGVTAEDIRPGDIVTDSGAFSHELVHRLQNSEVALHPRFGQAIEEAFEMLPPSATLGRRYFGREAGVLGPYEISQIPQTDMRAQHPMRQSAATEKLAYLLANAADPEFFDRRLFGLAQSDATSIASLYGWGKPEREAWGRARQHILNEVEQIIADYENDGRLPQTRLNELRQMLPRSARGRATTE